MNYPYPPHSRFHYRNMPIVVAGNWKMNKTAVEAAEMIRAMKGDLEAVSGVGTIICPSFPLLSAVAEILRGSTIHVGAQNMHHEIEGAYTGEVSAAMLKDTCRYVIVGHSERRLNFGETDHDVNLKTKAALEADLIPIVCVGERLEEREQGDAERFVSSQVRGALAGVHPSEVLVAYEPVWAIGTGRAATPHLAQEIMSLIRRELSDMWGPETARVTPLLYGGSVNPDNISDFVRRPDINGALVGGASLDADSFVEIVRLASSASSGVRPSP